MNSPARKAKGSCQQSYEGEEEVSSVPSNTKEFRALLLRFSGGSEVESFWVLERSFDGGFVKKGGQKQRCLVALLH